MVRRLSTILGLDGRPIEIDEDILTRQVAVPTVAGIRNIQDGHPAQNLDPYRLTQILRAAESGDATAQHELAEEIEEKDLHYQGILGTRKRAVAQLDITVIAAGDEEPYQKHAEFIREWLDRDTLEDELFDMLDAIGKGFSVTEVVWDPKKLPWVPIALEHVDPRWVEFDQVTGRIPQLKGGAEGNTSLPEPITGPKYIYHAHPAKSGLPIRGGLIRGIAWAYLFKNIALKDWTIFAEVYGQPIRVGKYGPTATDDDRRKLLHAVSSIATDAAAIIPASMMIEFINGAAAGNFEVFYKLLTYLDDLESKAVLGQTGTADAKPGGIGSGSANVHNEVRGDIKRADARKLKATFNQGLVRWMTDFNFGTPEKGLYPRIKIGESEEFTEDDRENFDWFIEHGGRVEESVVRDKIGAPDPPEKRADGKPVRLLRPRGQAASEKSAGGGQDGPGDPSGQKVAAARLRPAYDPLKGHLSLEASPPAAARDAIDGLVAASMAELENDWQRIMAPAIDPIAAVFAAATSYDDLKARLLTLPDTMRMEAMAELQARAGYMARLAGEAGLDIGGDAP